MTPQRFVLDNKKLVSRKQKPRTTSMTSQEASLSVATNPSYGMVVASSSSLAPSILRSLQQSIGNKRVQQLLKRGDLQLGAKPDVSAQMIPGYANKSQATSQQFQMQPTVQMDKEKEVHFSTPLPEGAVPQGNKAVVKVGNADITILPDTRTKSKKMEKKALTVPAWRTPLLSCTLTKDGKCSAVKVGSVKIQIRTTYGPNAERSDTSAYGRGTTKEDIAAGTTTLEFHEGTHGTKVMNYLKEHKMPQFEGKAGMSIKAFKQAGQKYSKELKAYFEALDKQAKEAVDCVGTKADFCKAEGE